MAAARKGGPQVPTYSLHRSTGTACVKIAGKRWHLGRHGSSASREAYARVVAAVLSGQPVTARIVKGEVAARSAPTASPSGSLTVRTLADRYRAHASEYYRRDGYPTSELGLVNKAIDRFVELFGELAAGSVTPLNLTGFQEQLVGIGLSRSGVNGSVSRVRRMYRWAGSRGLVPTSTTHGLELVPGLKAGRSDAPDSRPVLPVDDDLVDATLKHLGQVVADMVRLQRLTGARPGEVCTMRPCDLTRAAEVWVYRPASHKTQHHGRERTVFLGPRAQQVLAPYPDREPTAPCFQPRESEAIRLAQRRAARRTPECCGNRPGSNVQAVPVWRAGDQYSVGSYRQAIHRACIRAGLPTWNPNQLRHTAATEVRREFGLEASQVVLGHANARTSEIYAEKNLAAGAAVAKAIG